MDMKSILAGILALAICGAWACDGPPTALDDASATLSSAATTHASHYDIQPIAAGLTDPGVQDLNNRRRVVGFHGPLQHGFIWDGGLTQSFDYPGADFTFINGINDVGTFGGQYTIALANPPSLGGPVENHGFLMVQGVLMEVDFPGHDSWVFDVNNRGHVVGTYCEPGAVPGCLNDGAEVQHGYLKDGNGFSTIDPPGAVFTIPQSINDRGDVGGTFVDGDGVHGFLRDKRGSYTTVDVPGSTFTTVYGINARGDAVGEYGDASFASHGYVRKKHGEIVTFDVPGAPQTILGSINDHGDLAGNVINPAFELEAFIAVKRGGPA